MFRFAKPSVPYSNQTTTKRPVQFEITEQTQTAISKLITSSKLESNNFLFNSRRKSSAHLSTRQYAKLLKDWVAAIGLDPHAYGAHSLRRTKATLIYRRTKNLRAVSFCWAARNWKAPFATWESSWGTLWRLQSRRKSNGDRPERPEMAAFGL